MDRAGPASGDSASVLGSGQPELLSDGPEKRCIRINIGFNRGPIQFERNHSDFSSDEIKPGFGDRECPDTLAGGGSDCIADRSTRRHGADFAEPAEFLTALDEIDLG